MNQAMLDVLDLVKEIHTKIAKFAWFTSLKDVIDNEDFSFKYMPLWMLR